MTAPATEEERLARADGLESLLAPCLKCHELDASRSRMAPVRIAEPVMARSRFNHAPHVTETNCKYVPRQHANQQVRHRRQRPRSGDVPDVSQAVAGARHLRDLPRLPSAFGIEARGGRAMTGKILVRTAEGVLQEFPLGAGLRVGSGRASDSAIEGDGVLPEHANVGVTEQGGWIEAVGGSRVSINGEPADRRALRHLDVISLGDHVHAIFFVTSLIAARVSSEAGRVTSRLATLSVSDQDHRRVADQCRVHAAGG